MPSINPRFTYLLYLLEKVDVIGRWKTVG